MRAKLVSSLGQVLWFFEGHSRCLQGPSKYCDIQPTGGKQINYCPEDINLWPAVYSAMV